MVVVAILLRLFVGCGLASALGASGQLPTPFAAFLAGLASPLIIARLFQTISVVDSHNVSSVPTVQSPASSSTVAMPRPAAGNGHLTADFESEVADASS
jgi:hypothetical protein